MEMIKHFLLRSAAFSTALVVLLAASWSPVLSGEQFEAPVRLKASRILPPALRSGPDFKVAETVINDGYLNRYTVETSYGKFTAVSTLALTKLVREIKAIKAMAKVEESDTFTSSLQDSAKKTGKGLKSLFTDPKSTLEGAAQGMGRMFERAGEAISGPGPGQSEDSRARQFIGFSKSKREVAAKFGVDVYSTNKVLQQHLDRLAWADYAGGISLGAATSVVPGGAGLMITASGGARLLNDLMRTTPPSELRMMNRGKMQTMGVSADLIDLFIGSRIYSPREQTIIVGAMENMPGVKNRSLLVKISFQAQNRDLAFVITNLAVLYAAYHRKVKPLAELKPIARVLYARAQDGVSLVLLPTDYIVWSARMASVAADVQNQSGGKGCELWVTGRLSPRSSAKLKQAGWMVKTHIEKQLASQLQERTKK